MAEPELKAWNPTFGETAGNYMKNALMARGVSAPENALMAGHLGAYFTPAAPAAAAYDLYGLGRDISGRVRRMIDNFSPSPLADKEMSRDEFYSSKRKPSKSKDDLLSGELAMLQGTDRYKQAGRNQRARLEQEAKRRADERYSAQSSGAADDEKSIESDWNAYLSDIQRKRQEHYGKGWQERHPALADTAAIASYALPAFLARRGFNKLADEGKSILGEIKSAQGPARADAMLRLEKWKGSLPKEYSKVAAKAALIPAEIRTAGEVYDATFLPEGGARDRARKGLHETFTDPAQFAADMGPSLLTGLTSTAGGSLVSSRPPMSESNALLDIDGRLRLRDEMARLNAWQRPSGQARQAPSGELPGPSSGPHGPNTASPTPNPQPQSQPAFQSYRDGGPYQREARAAWNENLDSVPMDARASYTPDVNQAITAIEGRTAGMRPVNPAQLRGRAEGSQAAFNQVRQSGGDPFSQAGRELQLGAGRLAIGGLAFEQALSHLKQSLVDLDGDGVPDSVVPNDLGLGDNYNPYEVY